MATHTSVLAWRIPWTEEPNQLKPMESQRVGHNRATEHSTQTHLEDVMLSGISQPKTNAI